MVRNCRRRVRLVTPPGEAGRDVISGSLHYLLLLRAGDHRYWADHRLGLRSVRWHEHKFIAPMNVINHRRSGLRKSQKGLRAYNPHSLELRNRSACFLSESQTER